jgi:hypothetical protein
MVGDYSCKYILRTSILDEAERRGGDFDGTIGAILKDSDMGNVDAQMEKREGYYTPAWLSTEVGTAEESGSATQKTLVVRVGQSTRRFKLLKHDKIPGACVFGVSSLTNQAAMLKSNESPNAIPGYLLLIGSLSVLILPSAFIYGLTKFKKEGSTLMQRVWMMFWLCVNQASFFIFAPLSFSDPSFHILSGNGLGLGVLVFALLLVIPAIGGFVMVGKMLAEFGTCTLLS